jgi:hypothetical protein
MFSFHQTPVSRGFFDILKPTKPHQGGNQIYCAAAVFTYGSRDEKRILGVSWENNF